MQCGVFRICVEGRTHRLISKRYVDEGFRNIVHYFLRRGGIVLSTANDQMAAISESMYRTHMKASIEWENVFAELK